MDILVPSLPDRKIIVPVIIEVKPQHTNDIPSVNLKLESTRLQLMEQGSYLFADFPWQKEVIIIAGVGFYWFWWRVSESDCALSFDRAPAPPGDEGKSKPRPEPRWAEAMTPFILGTKTSDAEISSLQAAAREMVDQEGWEQSDPYVEVQGGDRGVSLQAYLGFLASLDRKWEGEGDSDGSDGSGDEGMTVDEDKREDEDESEDENKIDSDDGGGSNYVPSDDEDERTG